MAIGEIILGCFFQVLLDNLTSLALKYAQREGIPTVPLDQWKGRLETINAMLDDAEAKQLSGDRLVKLWLDDVRDLAYDMEDLLDEFKIEATQAKSKAKSSTSTGESKRKFSILSRPNSPVYKTKVEEINVRLEKILTMKDRLSLRGNATNKSNYSNKRLPSTSLPELQFFGREEEEAQVLELLITDVQNSDANFSVVPIVGMGGVGKTALAQRLYNHPRVSNCFEKRAWACVSDAFDVLNITKTILQSISKLPCEGKDLNWLQVKLKHYMSGKKFLVVLDDIWNEKYDEWTFLLKPFGEGGKGSKIIITTRNHSVVSTTGASPYLLKELSIDNCTSLLAYHALGARNFKRRPDLETIGKKIAKKCRGLPLAVKILGSLLRKKVNPDEWEAILNNKIWDVATGEIDEVLPALKLSYLHLPSNLKRCFAYCAIFPKDYEIDRDELALLWMSEGFLDGQKAKENILISGQNYFNELASRSFFQQSSVNASKFFMHDLLNDLAKSIAGVTCFTSEESWVVGDEDDASVEKKTRYASFVSPWLLKSENLKASVAMKALRSLMLLTAHDKKKFSISEEVLHELLTNLKHLRALSLCHCDIIKVPDCVGNLKHLRYLNLSYTKIEGLPKSIGTLCILQALILRGCRHLSKLPPDISKLVSLQFLDIRDTERLKDMPLSIGNLKNLILLSKFVVGPEEGSLLKELKNLSHLQGELLVSKLQNVKTVRDAIDANLCEKQGLNKLILLWDGDFGNPRDNERKAQVLYHLRPHPNLENLTISSYCGKIFPSWLGGPSYSKIVSLCLRGCPNVRLLPPLGQLPSLRELSLEDLNAVSRIGSEFYGKNRPFPSLKTLEFDQMSVWKDWYLYDGGQEEVPFSYLRHLVVRRCPELTGTLPSQLDHLIKLEIHSCSHLNNSTREVSLSSLYKLHLEDCNKEILKSLVNLTSLTILKIENLAELVCFDQEFMSHLVHLKELEIKSCGKLTYLWQDGNETRNLTHLERLSIESCPRFTSFVAGEGEIELPSNLERMNLWDCTSLEKLPSKMRTKYLCIWNCPKIMGLTIPPNDPNSNKPMSQLEKLRIGKCDTLISFSFAKGRLAEARESRKCKGAESLEEITVKSLKSLSIEDCKNLKSLLQCLHTLSHLTCLNIRDCPALKMEDFPSLPITLSSLQLENCPKIKSLPNRWHRLTSLQEIQIKKCPNIKRFPEGALPPNLRTFRISECKNFELPVRDWGLRWLTSLETLHIDFCMGGDGENGWFPSAEDEDAWSLLFPSSLTSLHIHGMRNVEGLSNGLCSHLSSLRLLEFYDCPNLKSLPADGFPPSLQQLFINREMKTLKDQCSKLATQYWSLIREIPSVDIGGFPNKLKWITSGS